LKGDDEDDEDGGNEVGDHRKIVAAAKVAHLLCVCCEIFYLFSKDVAWRNNYKGRILFWFYKGLLCSFPLGFFSYYNFALQELTWMVNQFLYSIICMNQIPLYMAHIIENNIEIYIQ